MKDVQTYLFHTSILSTNRQLYHEASNVFYIENLFVRVNSVTSAPFIKIFAFAANGDHGHLLPLHIFSNGSKVQACTRRFMEIDLSPCSSSVWQERNLYFIFAADELALLCKRLIWTDALYTGRIGILQRMELWIIIGDWVLNAPTYEMSAACVNATTKNASASRGEGPADLSRGAVEGSACTREETNWNGIARSSGATGDKLKSPALRDPATCHQNTNQNPSNTTRQNTTSRQEMKRSRKGKRQVCGTARGEVRRRKRGKCKRGERHCLPCTACRLRETFLSSSSAISSEYERKR